jgi:hypothetical protein
MASEVQGQGLSGAFSNSLEGTSTTDRFPSQLAARSAVFDHIEWFYNRQRLYSTLGYRCPIAYQHQRLEQAAVAYLGVPESGSSPHRCIADLFDTVLLGRVVFGITLCANYWGSCLVFAGAADLRAASVSAYETTRSRVYCIGARSTVLRDHHDLYGFRTQPAQAT